MTLRLLPIAAMTAAAFAAMSAHAASVDVYGVLDTGLHYTHSDSGDTSVTMDSGISKGSRVGIIGSEDLGNGCKIVFNLETWTTAPSTTPRTVSSTAMPTSASTRPTAKFALVVRARSAPASTARSSSTATRFSATSTRKHRLCRSSTIRSCEPTT